MNTIGSRFARQMEASGCSFYSEVNHFSGVELVERVAFPLNPEPYFEGPGDTKWSCACALMEVPDRPDAFDLKVRFTLLKGQSRETNVGVVFVFQGWDVENYLLMPAAVYNGNRFESRRIAYPPILSDPADIGPEAPTLISDVPRLNIRPGESRIQQLTRDLATPAVGFQAGREGLGFWMLTEQGTRLGDSGINVEESPDRKRLSISLNAPGVRQRERYTIADTHHPCEDRGADFEAGDMVEIRLRLFFFACPRLQGLFERFVEIRKDLAVDPSWKNLLPFSAAWKIQEGKYNRDNWDERQGYYAVGIRDESPYNHWQTGWVGGLMSTYPLLVDGSDLSRQRALRTFDFVFPAGQSQSGFLHGCAKDGVWFGDHFRDPGKPWLLIRKNSDALYFLMKQFLLLRKRDPAWQLPPHWETGARRFAEAFHHLWESQGQFGQFVDTQTGEIIVGGSASAAIAPAGLALAAQFFGDERYLETAQESAHFLYRRFVLSGYTTGGPGEILQCPDSESAFGLLESLVVLYEVTGEPHWLEKAEEQAQQCFTWCVSYDFKFPPGSTFGRLDMRTTGSVYANVQNKHSAPGICTLSGDSLFKLFRATGKTCYLELIREMAHNLPQYLSREDRPIAGMPAGWMNERVEMSDWLEPVGEIFYGSCWCEVSNMLTYVEIPGIYIQVDKGLVWTFDHVEAVVLENSQSRLVLEISNPTPFDARVKIMAENSADARTPWGANKLVGCPQIQVEAGGTRTVEFHMPGYTSVTLKPGES